MNTLLNVWKIFIEVYTLYSYYFCVPDLVCVFCIPWNGYTVTSYNTSKQFLMSIEEWMNTVLHCKAGYMRPGTTWAREMNFGMNNAPVAGSIIWSLDLQSSTLPLYHSCPPSVLKLTELYIFWFCPLAALTASVILGRAKSTRMPACSEERSTAPLSRSLASAAKEMSYAHNNKPISK